MPLMDAFLVELKVSIIFVNDFFPVINSSKKMFEI